MQSASHMTICTDEPQDVVLHQDIMYRAYELYERKFGLVDGDGINGELTEELSRVAYAAAQLQRHASGESGDTRAVRAARVYLHALSSFIADHGIRR